MHERMELKTHKLAVVLTSAWPMVLALLIVMGGTLLILPAMMALQLAGIMLVIVLLTLTICVPMYLGTYIFQPPTEYKGARIIARLGRNENEIGNVCASEILVKQNFIEKMLKVCHLRQKGSVIYLRGVPEPEKVKAWIAANFPEKTVVMRNQEMLAKKGKKKKHA